MPLTPVPPIGASPLSATAERSFSANPALLFEAWTTGFDLWFAQPGTLSMDPREGRAWFFYNRDDWGRHPHYGRFLRLDPNRLIETTWLTGNGTDDGTCGAETVLRIALKPYSHGTMLTLTHAGFVSERSREAHAENWPLALNELAEALARDAP